MPDLREDIRRALAPVLSWRLANPDAKCASIDAVTDVAFRMALSFVRREEIPIEILEYGEDKNGDQDVKPLNYRPEIIDGEAEGLYFYPKRSSKKHAICLHWTAGNERAPASRVHATLAGRRLSIHYVVTHDQIVKMADHDAVCLHAGGPINEVAIGIEICHPGIDKSADRTPFLGTEPRLASWDRDLVDRVCELCEILCGEIGIPRHIPPVTRGVSAEFRGVRGHFHSHASKLDPGPAIFEALRSRGFSEI